MLNDAEKLLAEIQRIDELLQLVQNAAGAGVALRTLLQNRVQKTADAGTVVAAAGAITPDAALTTKGTLGKIRISANFSGNMPATTTVTPVLQVKIGAGAFVTKWAWDQVTGPAGTTGDINCSAVFEFDTAAVAGTVITVRWQTTAGDGALTLGDGATGFAAALLVEELP
jgi:hypothetical protein